MKPKYLEIKDYLNNKIKKGILKAGDKIPSERELMELFNVSRMTVRQAIDRLVNEGILVKMVGKGTFVTKEKLNTRLNILKSFTEEIIASGHKTSAKLLSKREIRADPELAKKLKIPEYSSVLKVDRLRLVDGLVMSVNTSYFPMIRAFMIEELDFSATSIYQQIEKELGLMIEKAVETISANAADRRISGLLRVKVGTPLLKITRLTIISNNIPIEYMEGLFRPDRYVVSQELYR